ncbi:hypothetical protein JQN58_05285 [Aneurinibacillus sp. BA2021]|nr:hypothetical protein [Aneurinibacillus sp. BA2021]
MKDGIRISGEWIFAYEDGTVIRKKNLIVASGLAFLAALFIGERTNDIPFHLAIGTGTGAAVASDTKLQAEVFRKIVSVKTRQGNMLRLRTLLAPNEANGDWKEFGIALAGTEELESGTLFNRLVTPISKASNMALTIECRITLSAG